MNKVPVLPTLRELARCYQAFERYSAAHLRRMGMTPAQFDILATLKNTNGMCCRELGDKTLITKGTLTGVLDRLETRGLVRREANSEDARRVTVALTGAGEKEAARCFEPHVLHFERAFEQFDKDQLLIIQQSLAHLREAFEVQANQDQSRAK